jgi:DNA polymerase-3 subunit delta'
MFDSVIGHLLAKTYFEKALKENRLAHTLLFEGIEGVGKKKLALCLGAQLLQTSEEKVVSHPDFHLLVPEGKVGLHAVDTLKKAMEEAEKAPFQAPSKLFVIDAAERMQPAASNALLKTLEEPPPNSRWILITSKPSELLPTIISRCAKIPFHPLNGAELALILGQLGLPLNLVRSAQGSVSKAIELSSAPQVEEARKLLFTLLREKVPYTHLLKALERIEKLLEIEDPLTYQRRVAYLLECIGMFFRDQELRSLEPSSKLLFFPEEPSCSVSHFAWKGHLGLLEQCEQAVERNLRLTAALETFFLKIHCC